MKALKKLRRLGRIYRKTLTDEDDLEALLSELLDTPFAKCCAAVVQMVEEPRHVPYLENVPEGDDEGYRWVGLRAWAYEDYPFLGTGIILYCGDPDCDLCN